MLAEGMAAGIPPHVLLDYTPRELYAVFAGRNLANRRAYALALFQAWHAEAFARGKRLPPLKDMLRKLEPPRVMSTQAMRRHILGMAEAMGATVRHVKKGELN